MLGQAQRADRHAERAQGSVRFVPDHAAVIGTETRAYDFGEGLLAEGLVAIDSVQDRELPVLQLPSGHRPAVFGPGLAEAFYLGQYLGVRRPLDQKTVHRWDVQARVFLKQTPSRLDHPHVVVDAADSGRPMGSRLQKRHEVPIRGDQDDAFG